MAGVQFNLLPDIKIEADKARHTRSLVYTTAIIITAASLAIFIIMLFSVGIIQKKQMNDAGKAVDTANSQLKNKPNLNQIITINNQLQSLVGLHQNKDITSRIFTYLPQVTPTNVSIGKLDIDLQADTMTITGNADSQKTVNTFVDTLKLTTYTVGSNSSAQTAFPSVVESGFAINPTNVSYTLDLQFDPKLFANNLLDNQGRPQTPKLTVPKLSSTKSAIDNPSSTLFKAQTGDGAQ